MADNGANMSFGCYRPKKHSLEKVKKAQIADFAVFPKYDSGIIIPKEKPRWKETVTHKRTGHGHIRIKRVYFCEIEKRPKSEVLRGRRAEEWLGDMMNLRSHKDRVINESAYQDK